MYRHPNASIHAEAAAIGRLPPHPPNRRRLQKVDLLVIRTSPRGRLGSSKPCLHCLLLLRDLLPARGYRLVDIYHSTPEGALVCTSLDALLADPQPHVSRYYVQRQWAQK